jgi:hypothetical protein
MTLCVRREKREVSERVVRSDAPRMMKSAEEEEEGDEKAELKKNKAVVLP